MGNAGVPGPRVKRRKISAERSGDAASSGAGSITSHKQLRRLLLLKQDSPSETRLGINAFKDFLNSINQPEHESEKPKKLEILKAYCDSQRIPGSEDSPDACFPDLIQCWRFADTNNNDSLLVLVPSVLAIFLRTVSSQLEFRDFGVALCRHLLQKEQLRLFNRNLTSQKAKEHLISPCLRLLTEIVGFDGGAVARLAHAKRDIVLKRLDIFLTPNKAQTEGDSEDAKKSTLRRNAQRLVLANLRFQHGSAKSEFIEQHKIMRAFLEHVRRDPPEIVADIVKAIEQDIAQDASVPRSTKTKFFNRWNLERLVTLYGYDQDLDDSVPEDTRIANQIHRVLTKVCTKPEMGVLLSQNGWYPPGYDPESPEEVDEGYIDLGLDSPYYEDRYWENVPVRNGTLAALAQVLRPETDTRQMELLLQMFRVAPELIADYFTKRVMFTSDPKATPSWLGESAFLFSTVQLPVPAHCGWKGGYPVMPPPVSIVLENILPRPLTQKILTRCLNQNAEIVTLFAVRILTASIRKLRSVLKMFLDDQGYRQDLWMQAADRLRDEFCNRCPSLKDVILAFKRTASDDIQQQDAIMELVALFYEILPLAAAEVEFDVTLTLTEILGKLEKPDLSSDDSETLLGFLQHTLTVAEWQSSMRWWQHPASLQYSAFTSILKVVVQTPDNPSMRQTWKLLQAVLFQHHAMINAPASFDALLSSLKSSDSDSLHVQLQFLDNCLTRISKQPVHYRDIVDSLRKDTPQEERRPLSPLVGAIQEQWAFVVKANDSDREKVVAAWVGSFLAKLKEAGEDGAALDTVRLNLVEQSESKKAKSTFKKAFKGLDVNHEAADIPAPAKDTQPQPKLKPSADIAEVFGPLPSESKNHTSLQKWESEELEMAIDNGRVRDLILFLCSEHEEIRRQAFAAISRLMVKVKNSKYTEWRATYILLGELRETASQFGLDRPLPYIVGECAASCLEVLTDPLHFMYAKVNKFLQKYPSWEVGKIPSYWIDKVFLQASEVEGRHMDEVRWLLSILLRGARTAQDVDIYRRAKVFEHLLVLYSWPDLDVSVKKTILHILYRIIQAGGSTVLVTRAAIVHWIAQRISMGDPHEALLRPLARIVYDTADHDRVDRWSQGGIPQVLEGVGA